MTRKVSPNEIIAAACKQYGLVNPPTTEEDWMVVLNYVAYNVMEGVEIEILKIFRLLYKIPLSVEVVINIAKFQMHEKEVEKAVGKKQHKDT